VATRDSDRLLGWLFQRLCGLVKKVTLDDLVLLESIPGRLRHARRRRAAANRPNEPQGSMRGSRLHPQVACFSRR
jgi:hypothetical protein